MTPYYIVMFDSNPSNQCVDDWDAGTFDILSLYSGAPIGPIPSDVRITLSTGNRVDLVANPLQWLIVSKRLKEVIAQRCGDGVQFVDMPMYYRGKVVRNYYVANPLGKVRAFKGRTRNIQLLELNHNKIPLDAHLFRMEYVAPIYVMSDAMRKDIRAKGLKGISIKQV